MKQILERAVAAESFNGRKLYGEIRDTLPRDPNLRGPLTTIGESLQEGEADCAILAAVRFAFLIELVKTPKIETTKFEVRWADRVRADDDLRFASYDECSRILRGALSELAEALVTAENRELVQLFLRHSLLAYEVPIDYKERLRDRPFHRAENVGWFWGDIPSKTVRLRHFLLTETAGAERKAFSEAYRNKIKVKTYLTDRSLTGAHKTNREKRWEAHPGSVQFALRQDCLDIERALINQLCRFDGFPKGLHGALVDRKLIDPSTEVFRCPVTMEALSFDAFKKELLDPRHGKADFQVGHLNPLKAINDDPRSGHTAQNISWVCYDGNRIQGSLPLTEVRALIRRIASNYEKFGAR